jgi:type IV pilus assembly protein PilO
MPPATRLLFSMPIILGGGISTALAGLVVWPQWQQFQLGQTRLAELQATEARLPLMKRQLEREQSGTQTAQKQQAQVLDLIAGSGSLATFMAQVDRLAALSGVRLALYEPAAATVGEPSPSRGAGANAKSTPAPPADPLLAPGVSKQEVLLSAAGSYPALLSFMRQLEKLSVLVVQSNLQLSNEERPSDAATATSGPQPAPGVLLKMRIATYSRARQ